MAAEWYFRVGGSEFGPLAAADLAQQAARGQIRPDTEVRKNDGPWCPASRVAGLFDRAAHEQPPPRPAPDPPSGEGRSVFVPAPGTRPSMPAMCGRYEVLDRAEVDGFRVEVLAYPNLSGARDPQTAANLHFAQRAGIRLKQVRITLRDGEAIVESGALHFYHGRIEMESRIGGVVGLGKAMMNKFVTKEAAVMPRYRGVGPVYLEPSFSHFLIHRLRGEELIAGKGMFYCGEGTLDVGSTLQRNVSPALLGGKGLVRTFRGTGSVRLAPTQAVHQRLQSGGMSTLGAAPRGSNTAT